MINTNGSAIGYFREKDCGNTFPVYANPSYGIEGQFGAGFPHIIIVSHAPINESGWRYATVLKSVARVVVDESDDGQPVIEKWRIKFYS
jgi:hypothetical protein